MIVSCKLEPAHGCALVHKKKLLKRGKKEKKKKASIFTSENWHFKDSAKTGYDTFEALSKEQLKFFAISAGCQVWYWSQGRIGSWTTKQELLNHPSGGQRHCTRRPKTEKHLCLWKVNYHYPIIGTRCLENTETWCIFLKRTLTFEGSGKMLEVLLNHLKFKKSFSAFLLEKGNC